MDLFPVKLTTTPNKPNGQKYTPEEFFNYFRLHINEFVNPDFSQFYPINEPSYGINETVLWNSSNPLGALITIEMPLDHGTIMCTGFSSQAWTCK